MRDSSRASFYAPLRVVVYSSNAGVRQQVQQALGRMPDSRTPPLDFVHTATPAAVLRELTSSAVDIVVLDGEAAPYGGLGLAKQLKDELLQCPPTVVITARPDDAWLARWSKADVVLTHPIDPIVFREALVPLLRGRLVV
ncbi:chemotaxis protein CheY [Mycobacterium sp. URHB0044]|jgi:DNA-binding NarL/FixJ family response regulator|uniref:chemotaxis protein CheY n=1 Tax=Mycobacterium sp. URHB0044 TaxID=1380386 RepID=UPI00048D6E43|nr:chemotaxis protein CheY [Mycobacterium sp. URHB0044]